MRRVSFAGMATRELMELCIGALAELQERQRIEESKGVKLEYTQSKDCMFFNDQGIPVDRPGWLYIPALSGVSLNFQPRETNGRKRYATYLKEGSILEARFKDNSETKRLFLRMESGEKGEIRDNKGNLIAKGAFKVL